MCLPRTCMCRVCDIPRFTKWILNVNICFPNILGNPKSKLCYLWFGIWTVHVSICMRGPTRFWPFRSNCSLPEFWRMFLCIDRWPPKLSSAFYHSDYYSNYVFLFLFGKLISKNWKKKYCRYKYMNFPIYDH